MDRDAPVKTVELRDRKGFVVAALDLLSGKIEADGNARRQFLDRYSSWERVAKAELNVYQSILAKNIYPLAGRIS